MSLQAQIKNKVLMERTPPNTQWQLRFQNIFKIMGDYNSFQVYIQTKMPLQSYKKINQGSDGVSWHAKVKATTANKSTDGVSSLESSSH
jgi:hypothetical protein